MKISGKDFRVTAVAGKAFKNNKKIASAETGDNVKVIGASAFEGCTKLSKAALGKGIAEIGGNAFKNCRKLGTITIKSTKLKKSAGMPLRGLSLRLRLRLRQRSCLPIRNIKGRVKK